jgi:5-methylcytosine-specific restriction endonuclease McrA
MAKRNIPVALKRQVWLKNNGEVFKAKCAVKWCENIITAFDHEAGHNIPESKGGTTNIDNLLPICSSCNKSMGNKYSITEFSEQFKKTKKQFSCFSCFK